MVGGGGVLMTHPTSRGSQAWGGCVMGFRGGLRG